MSDKNEGEGSAQHLSPVADLWSFMVEVYGLPGVAAACLSLQEEFGVDVPLFLAVLHACGRGCRIDAETVITIDGICAQWRVEVVRPLRDVRTRLKSNPWMGSRESVPELREAIKALELRAERIETAALQTALAELPMRESSDARDVAAHRSAAALVIGHFAGRSPEPEPPAARLVAEAARSLARNWMA